MARGQGAAGREQGCMHKTLLFRDPDLPLGAAEDLVGPGSLRATSTCPIDLHAGAEERLQTSRAKAN